LCCISQRAAYYHQHHHSEELCHVLWMQTLQILPGEISESRASSGVYCSQPIAGSLTSYDGAIVSVTE
jgi:hypothetical protein